MTTFAPVCFDDVHFYSNNVTNAMSRSFFLFILAVWPKQPISEGESAGPRGDWSAWSRRPSLKTETRTENCL